ncbi:M24 family metallopeptidase [Plantactinospora sp. KLBMP9567]|uniref:M24 family metallopeptidase n=1 Tax=Plantactinospora sp. KLBMP9567 TaxID=3085900 RepID=UPI002980CB78|nr:M24 family metallopeptidase [Plantactinospora sp. KLBMP9567]MDW5327855.1 M24 family metallopeptidase [Plantactinospora sp. KLBMP9567]
MTNESAPDPRIAAVVYARKAAAVTLAEAIRAGDSQVTEKGVCDRWSALLAADPRLLAEGWYQPPPNGVSALIGEGPDWARMSYVSLRHQQTWPRDDIQLKPGSLMYAYASPVVADSFMIGDLGVTVYGGEDEQIWEHLSTCFEITAAVAAYAEVGMELRELYNFAAGLMEKAALVNETYSTTDVSGGVDIGHTLPWTYEEPTTEQLGELRSGDFRRMAKAISMARLFHNAEERQKIEPTMAFTVEPRMAGPDRPLASFHVLVSFDQGVKRIHCDFAEIFSLFGMNSRLPQQALTTLGCL